MQCSLFGVEDDEHNHSSVQSYDLIWDLVAYERAVARRHEVIVHCGLCGVEHDERNDPLVQAVI